MGACLFVVVDGIFFGGLFALYATLHASSPEVFSHGRYFLDARVGAMESCILLASGLTAVLAVRAAKLGRGKSLGVLVTATLALAALFLFAQGDEYGRLFERGLLPGSHFAPSESVWETAEFRREHPAAARYGARFHVKSAPVATKLGASAPQDSEISPLLQVGALGVKAIYPDVPSEPRNAHVFFGLYFLFTGVLALHVAGGALGWAWLLLRKRRSTFAWHEFVPFDSLALSWNLMALVRVLMFPVLYLIH
jgi:heme/copper-type cytochrome/quinol oxidase subunit 3